MRRLSPSPTNYMGNDEDAVRLAELAGMSGACMED